GRTPTEVDRIPRSTRVGGMGDDPADDARRFPEPVARPAPTEHGRRNVTRQQDRDHDRSSHRDTTEEQSIAVRYGARSAMQATRSALRGGPCSAAGLHHAPFDGFAISAAMRSADPTSAMDPTTGAS